ncbi:MAG: MopE-related protein [bacterium]
MRLKVILMLFGTTLFVLLNTITNAKEIRTPQLIDNTQYNINEFVHQSRDSECYWMSYFQNIGYIWKAPHPTWGDESYAMRFTAFSVDTLKLVEFYVYDPEDGTFGNDTVFISVWGDNGTDLPDINNMLAQVAFPPGTYNAYPNSTIADFSSLNIGIAGDYHVSFSSSGAFPNDYETCLSDDGNNGTGRSSCFYDGAWGSMDTIWGFDVNFYFSVYLCGEGKICYYDADEDTYGDINNIYLSVCGHCHEELGFVEDSTDCDDDDPNIHPGVYDLPEDGIDQNCDGVDNIYCYDDNDYDTYGSPYVVTIHAGVCPSGFSTNNDDCDDTDENIHPGAPEIIDDGIDQDCNGDDFCCVHRGDVAEPNDDMVLVNDIVYLVNYIFKSGTEPACLDEGDCAIPLDGEILVNDIVWLVNFLFKSGAVPPTC